MNISSNDLQKDDLIPFTHPDGLFDLMVIECVEWEAKEVTVKGFSLLYGQMAMAQAPFNQLVEVWNA